MCLPWLVWGGIPWVGVLECWASWWERSFPECSPKLLVPGKLIIYITKLCPLNKVYIDPASLFKTQGKKKKKVFFIYPPFLIPWELQFGQMFQCKFSLLSLHPQINPLHFPSVSVAVWATRLGNEALILKICLEFLILLGCFHLGSASWLL